MPEEIGPLKLQLENPRNELCGHIVFYLGDLCGQSVVLVQSGIGKVNAAIATQTMILKYAPKLIVNSGVAGAISKELKICDVVVASGVFQYDLDISVVRNNLEIIPGLGIGLIDCHRRSMQKLLKVSSNVACSGIIATGDSFVNGIGAAGGLCKKISAVAVEMECGSVGQSCFLNRVDFCVLKVISDLVWEPSDNYEKFKDVAAQKSAQILIEFLKMK
jgi:adenosylhomocysteine nucleosidase